MSQSERIDFLRAQIASLEAEGCGTPLKSWRQRDETPHVRLGGDHIGMACGLDRVLQDGLGTGSLHEIVALRPGDRPAASGFAFALAARFAATSSGVKSKTKPAIIWIIETKAAYETGQPYAPGFDYCGLDPAQLVLVETRDAHESLWAMEEALRCRSPAAVIGEVWSLPKVYDLAASRRLLLAARKSGTPGLLVAAGFAGQAEALSSGATTRFEVSAHPSRSLPSAGHLLPLPGLSSWSVRLVKARAGPLGFDRNQRHSLFWDPEKACFRDALPFAFPSLSGDRPARPAWSFPSALNGRRPDPMRDLHEGQSGVEAGGGRSLRTGVRA
jgi:protein ImuA